MGRQLIQSLRDWSMSGMNERSYLKEISQCLGSIEASAPERMGRKGVSREADGGFKGCLLVICVFGDLFRRLISN